MARTPEDQLQFLGDVVELPRPVLPVGTKFPANLLLDNGIDGDYYVKKIMKEAEADTRKILRSLRRQGFCAETKGGKLAPMHIQQLEAIKNIVTKPDSVEIAGHYPSGMHVNGSISNQCYLQNGQCHSGVSFDLFLLFRKTVGNNKVVYIHPYPIYGESRLLQGRTAENYLASL